MFSVPYWFAALVLVIWCAQWIVTAMQVRAFRDLFAIYQQERAALDARAAGEP